MTNLTPLWSPLQIGTTQLPNRVALAPMTRISATEDGLVTGTMISYYEAFARGGFGLLITEGIYPDTAHSQGYLYQPGLANDEQARSWADVVDAVHAAGSTIFAQLMHAGSQAQGNRFVDSTIAPSAVAPKGEQLGFYRGEGPYRVPAEITREQMEEVREGFVAAALRAKETGFDGVEISRCQRLPAGTVPHRLPPISAPTSTAAPHKTACAFPQRLPAPFARLWGRT